MPLSVRLGFVRASQTSAGTASALSTLMEHLATEVDAVTGCGVHCVNGCVSLS